MYIHFVTIYIGSYLIIYVDCIWSKGCKFLITTEVMKIFQPDGTFVTLNPQGSITHLSPEMQKMCKHAQEVHFIVCKQVEYYSYDLKHYRYKIKNLMSEIWLQNIVNISWNFRCTENAEKMNISGHKRPKNRTSPTSLLLLECKYFHCGSTVEISFSLVMVDVVECNCLICTSIFQTYNGSESNIMNIQNIF